MFSDTLLPEKDKVDQGSAPIFFNGPDGKYLRVCRSQVSAKPIQLLCCSSKAEMEITNEYGHDPIKPYL